MSVELISVLVAVLAMGVTLAGLILTSSRGLRQDMAQQDMRGCERTSASYERTWGSWNLGCETTSNNWATVWADWSIAKPSWKGCWKDCARPSPDGSRPAKGRTWAHLYLNKLSKELEWTPELPEKHR